MTNLNLMPDGCDVSKLCTVPGSLRTVHDKFQNEFKSVIIKSTGNTFFWNNNYIIEVEKDGFFIMDFFNDSLYGSGQKIYYIKEANQIMINNCKQSEIEHFLCKFLDYALVQKFNLGYFDVDKIEYTARRLFPR